MPLLSLILANPSSSPEEREFDKTKVTYFLYTRDNPEVGQQILWDFESVDDTNWDPTKKTYLLIHGWTASITFSERFVGGKIFFF